MIDNYLNVDEIHSELYKILKITIQFFVINNINYILCGGTMLGAVRHNGFIPWDDDVDILVPRDDYDKLLNLFKNNDILSDKDANIVAEYTGKVGYPYPFIKIINKKIKIIDSKANTNLNLNLFIDIFPLDHFPNNDLLHRIYIFKNKFFRAINTIYTNNEQGVHYGKAVRIALNILYNLFGGYRNICLIIDNMARNMNKHNLNSNFVGDGTWPENMKDYFTVDSCLPTILHIFEDSKFNIPKNYDKYLKTFYGDYMILPPEGKRYRHDLKVFRIK